MLGFRIDDALKCPRSELRGSVGNFTFREVRTILKLFSKSDRTRIGEITSPKSINVPNNAIGNSCASFKALCPKSTASECDTAHLENGKTETGTIHTNTYDRKPEK
jgi:hypothetical protein